MKGDMISRSALLNEFDPDEFPSSIRVRSRILQAPTVDAVPVVHGRWEWHEEWTPSTTEGPCECITASWLCSNCKIDLARYLTDVIGELVYIDNCDQAPKIAICPSCGAQMDKGDGE